jgi:hypothetical protein
MFINQARRQALLDKLAGLERDIAMSLFALNSDDRCIVCELAIAFEGFPEDVLVGPGFRALTDDETAPKQPMREFRSFDEIATAVQQTACDAYAEFGAPQALVKVVARYDGLDNNIQFCLGAVDALKKQAAHTAHA